MNARAHRDGLPILETAQHAWASPVLGNGMGQGAGEGAGEGVGEGGCRVQGPGDDVNDRCQGTGTRCWVRLAEAFLV